MAHLKLVSSTTPSSAISDLPDRCEDCGFRSAPDGCACGYIAELRPDGKHRHLLPRATRMSVLSHDYDRSCPCPWCYMQRMWSFAPPSSRPDRKDL